MSMQSQRTQAMRVERPAGEVARSPRPGRLIPILLALYLTPALLVVLLVGGVGILVLAAARVITAIVRGPEAWPRNPVRPESSTS